MASKKQNPFLEKKEEKLGKDLDKDGEKGEPKAHQMKVLGKKGTPPPAAAAAAAKGKGKSKIPPSLQKGKLMGGICTTCKKKPCIC